MGSFQDPDRPPHLDYFIHPVPASAMILMALNDHWLKREWPSWLTGKLSDFLGVFYFPLLLIAFFCLFQNYVLRQRPLRYITRVNLATSMVVTVGLMAALKLSPTVARLVAEEFSRVFFRIRIVPDPTDLVALSSLALTYFFARPFISRPPKSQLVG
jgi:hypothetical protein